MMKRYERLPMISLTENDYKFVEKWVFTTKKKLKKWKK